MKKHDMARKMKPLDSAGKFFLAQRNLSYKGKKGKGSLNKPKGEKNEGEKHYLGKNEQPIA